MYIIQFIVSIIIFLVIVYGFINLLVFSRRFFDSAKKRGIELSKRNDQYFADIHKIAENVDKNSV